ncbi:MAG: DUF4198 domain-containing protein [Pseudomonadota bacterium]
MRKITLALSLVVASITGAAQGHEFWIDPLTFFVTPGTPIRADIKVGENFKGTPSVYLPSRFNRFDIGTAAGFAAVQSRQGDRPALNQIAPNGLAVVVHETTNSQLTYTEFAKFEKFVAHKDANWVIDEHRARGLPEDEFVEVYSRYAKSLIAVGSGQGADRNVGLLTEIVALANPYTDNVSNGIPVRVLYRSAPRAGAQVEVFERAPGGDVRVFLVTANASGEARIPVKAGYSYMLDSVVLRAPEGAAAQNPKAVWESLWANLTFAVPG